MLTKTDLKAIDNLFIKRIDEATTNRIDPIVTKRINEAIDTRVDRLIVKRIREELKPVKEDIAKMRKDINLLVSFFDREYVNLRTRVERIEEHLHLPSISS